MNLNFCIINQNIILKNFSIKSSSFTYIFYFTTKIIFNNTYFSFESNKYTNLIKIVKKEFFREIFLKKLIKITIFFIKSKKWVLITILNSQSLILCNSSLFNFKSSKEINPFSINKNLK